MVDEIKIIIFILLYILIFVYNSDIKNNPIKTDNRNNPLDFYISFNQCDVKSFSQSNDIEIIEEINELKLNDKSIIYSSNIFLCMNQNNNEFLFADYNLYSITTESNNIKSTSINDSLPHNGKYFGYLKKQIFTSSGPRYPGPTNDCNNINGNEIILYGINNNIIIFYYNNDKNIYNISFTHTINE